MEFSHHPEIWSRFPELAAHAIFVPRLRGDVDAAGAAARFHAIARERLAATPSEAQWPEVNAWRRVFSRMGVKPTQYRCASESLLRRLRKEGELPAIHPLIDLCNAASVASGIPVAVFDAGEVAWPLQVRFARGDESYRTLAGELEVPEPGEVSFIDSLGRAHSRRWTHRQSGLSAIRPDTAAALIVLEAVHETARRDVDALGAALGSALADVWRAAPLNAVLMRDTAVFEFR